MTRTWIELHDFIDHRLHYVCFYHPNVFTLEKETNMNFDIVPSYRWCHMHMERLFAATRSQSCQLFAKSVFGRHSMGHQRAIVDPNFQTIRSNQVRLSKQFFIRICNEQLNWLETLIYRVEWPGKENQAAQPKGYVYIIFESEKQVRELLNACTIQDGNDANSGNYYFKISSKRIKAKEVNSRTHRNGRNLTLTLFPKSKNNLYKFFFVRKVEVIPWIIADSNYVIPTSQKLDAKKTVFVGALHGKLTADGLAKIMNDLFDGVVYAGKSSCHLIQPVLKKKKKKLEYIFFRVHWSA